MNNDLVERCLKTASATGAFSPDELDVLEDVLLQWMLHPGRDYVLLTESIDGDIAGFLIYGPAPMTRFAYDMYWIAVAPGHQKKGVGGRLEQEMCKALLEGSNSAVIRVETAGRDDYLGQRNFYLARSYEECGRIPDFYSEGDDLVLYCKKLSKKQQ